MAYSQSSGRHCVVVGCNNNQKRLYQWKNTECVEHDGMRQQDCACMIPYRLHRFPTDEENRRLWIRSINRKDFKPSSSYLMCLQKYHTDDNIPSATHKNKDTSLINHRYQQQA